RGAFAAAGAVAVGVGDLEGGMAVVAVGPIRRGSAGAAHADGAGLIHAESPLRDVVVMGAPVGHLAAGGLVPPGDLVMATLGHIFDARRRAEPEVPVEPFEHRPHLERAAHGIRADQRRHAADLADAAVAHQLGGETEAAVVLGALLRA